ncbi:uncharacterized protein BDV17DRAFT_301291 [Aspergillus undulatus]|uniref:uncharacterized protein n=1 Tax=Aspergillus undulatus TaxID=1810928 RepID=UPI003CCDADC7
MAAAIQRLEPPPGFVFVSVTGTGKPRSADSKVIRSHCMRGKNRRIGLPRRLATPGRATAVHHGNKPQASSSSLHYTDKQIGYGNEEERKDQGRISKPTRLTTLRRPSDLSALEFAFEMSNENKALIIDFLQYFTSAMYPIELFLDYDVTTCDWANWLFTDTVYLQCSLFMASTMHDLTLNKSISTKTYSNLRETIIALNKRLSTSDQEVALSDSTLAVVITLTMFCCMISDHGGARAHAKGLKMMVKLRGGMQGVMRNRKLYLKLGRVDLIYALNTGSQGLLCTYPVPFTPAFHNLNILGQSNDIELFRRASIYDTIDPRILSIFREMQHYTALVNAAHATGQRRRIEEFHTAISSFQYRLLQLQGSVQDKVSECLRLALLAFLITTFQFPGMRARYPYLADCLRQACRALASLGAMTQGSTEITKWILIVGGISVHDIQTEDWMREMWKAHSDDAGWETVRAGLKHILWVDTFQDRIGKITFEDLNKVS